MTELAFPVVGAGQMRDHDDEHQAEPAEATLAQLPPPPAPAVAGPLAIEVEWEARRLKKPLQLVVGRTVNWRIKSRLGVDTDAGLMSDEQAMDIAEPAAEILNRHDTTRALAARGVELELIAAIYEYVQETSVRAGQAAYAARNGLRVAARPVDAPPAAPAQPFATEPPPPQQTYDEGDDQL